MNISRQFSSENMLMSVCGHLLLVAVMVTSFAIVVERANMVAPDRVEIVEIDLSAVRVSGDETRLYNTAVPAPVKEPEPIPEAKPEPAPTPQKADVATPKSDAPLETPSLVEEEPAPTADTPQPETKADATQKEENKADDTPTPKKKTVVRVKREVLSLDRTLTISVVDALRVAMTRCWVIDSSRPDIADIRAVAHLTMRQNGTVRDVWFESAARADTDPAFAYVLETIRNAINVCQPFKMLPPAEFKKWEKIQLTFYPTTGKVM